MRGCGLLQATANGILLTVLLTAVAEIVALLNAGTAVVDIRCNEIAVVCFNLCHGDMQNNDFDFWSGFCLTLCVLFIFC